MKRPQNFDELLDIAKKRPDVHGALSQLGKSLKRAGRSMDGIRWQIETKSGTSGDFSAIVFIEMDDGSWKICDNKSRTGQQFIDAITLLREIFHVSFDDAVYMLSGGAPSAPIAKPQKLDTLKREITPQEKPTYTPPTPAPDKLRNVKAYLIQTRKIPKELVLPLIDCGKIYATYYENPQTHKQTLVCAFKITDENGNDVGCDSCSPQPQIKFKHLFVGSNAGYAWCFPYEIEEITSETPIFFCEAPIDTMSLCALSGTPGIYVSMAGLKDSTFNSVSEKLGGTPIICVDNDEAGDKFAARHPNATRMVAPIGKDWNDTLKYYVENNMSYAFAPPDAVAAPDVPLEENVAHVHYESEDVDPKKENGALDKGASVDEEIQADKGLLKFINDIEQMQDKSLLSKRSYNIGLISENHRILLECLFKNEFNIEHDFSGYSMQINGSAVSHIQKRHGKNGNADQTMANDEDIAKLGIIANSADEFEVLRKADGSIDTSAEFRNKKGERSPKIALKKSIDNNTFVVIECVPESNKKTIHIVSARKEKGGIGQVLNIEANASPQLTSKTPVDYPATTNIVPENTEKVNTLDEKNSKPLNDEDPPIADNNEKHSQDELRAELEAKVANVVNNYRADPRALAEYVLFSSRFNNYSANNLRLIWAQYPYAQYVTSAYDFSHGLPDKNGNPTVSEKIFIKKGERALRIWKPYDVKYTVMPDGTEKRSAWLTKSEREQAKVEKWKELTRKYFTLVPVFDITQTTASPDVYPKLCGLGGTKGTSADARFNALKNYCENVLNCPIIIRDFGERKATVRGSFYPDLNEIHISDMLEGENKLSTFIHELGHATLHADSYKNASKSTAQIELEADMYALMIERRLGIEPTDARCRHLKAHYDEYIAEIKSNDINADTELFNSVIDRYREQIPLIDAYVDNLNVAESQTSSQQNKQTQSNDARLGRNTAASFKT